METTGKINFLKKKDFQNAEKQDISCGGSTENPPSVIIRDGITDNEQLGLLGLGMGWLKQQLRENDVSEKRGLPIISFRNLADFSIIPEIMTSRHTNVNIGTTPIIMGIQYYTPFGKIFQGVNNENYVKSSVNIMGSLRQTNPEKLIKEVLLWQLY